MKMLRYVSRRLAELTTYMVISGGAAFVLLFAFGQELEIALCLAIIIAAVAAAATIFVRLSPAGREDKSTWDDGIGDGRAYIMEAQRLDKQWFIWW